MGCVPCRGSLKDGLRAREKWEADESCATFWKKKEVHEKMCPGVQLINVTGKKRGGISMKGTGRHKKKTQGLASCTLIDLKKGQTTRRCQWGLQGLGEQK